MIQDSGRIKEFTDLTAWQEAHKLVLGIYRLTKKFPQSEQYALTSQMQRSAISITSNIAEGFGRQSYREKIQFYYISHGSLTELKNQILIARDLHYLIEKEFDIINEQLIISHKLLQGLIKKSKTFLNPES
ncbi:MAG: four helix bundle protein [Candidatus Taylorbacteria bacterium]